MNLVSQDDEKRLWRIQDRMLFNVWDRSGLEVKVVNSQVVKSNDEDDDEEIRSEFKR